LVRGKKTKEKAHLFKKGHLIYGHKKRGGSSLYPSCSRREVNQKIIRDPFRNEEKKVMAVMPA